MANTKSAAKRARQTERRALVNHRTVTAVKNSLKAARVALKAGDSDAAKAAASLAVSKIDRAAQKGRVHKNAANRHKSAIQKRLAAPVAK